MAGNKFFNNQNVYVETDYDNILVIDPNKVVDSDGVVSERLVNHEELVIYANLEAKVIPRSKLVIGSNFNDTLENIRVGSIENDQTGVINFMTPQNQKGDERGNKYFDTKWSDTLTFGSNSKDIDSQMLGITSISIKLNTSYTALVNIEMEDVQGRVLFEQGENSPYSAFFQLPYPLFTLTIKGYYGKAMRHELMLKDFNARFDPQSGNYKISTNYITRNYALLSDIPINALFALPHMYSRTSTIGQERTSTESTSTTQEIRTVRSTRGYDAIKSAYSTYKSKGLIDEDFPELTLNQMLMKLENFERYVMEAYGKEDMSVLNDIDLYNQKIDDFRSKIFGRITDNWSSKYIDFNSGFITKTPNQPTLYTLRKELITGENALQNIENAKSDLTSIINEYNTLLNENTTFGEVGECEINGEKIETSLYSSIKSDDLILESLDLNNIDYEKTYQVQNNKVPTDQELSDFTNKIKSELSIESNVIDASTLQLENSTPNKTFFIFGDILGSSKFNDRSFLGKLQQLQDKFETKRQEVEEKLSIALAEKIKSPDVGLGFSPTIKNVMAVICASADGFLKLMDQVHDDAWEQRKNPIRLSAVITPEKSDGTEALGVGSLLETLNSVNSQNNNNPIVYPWPQYYVTTIDEDGNEQFEDRYPGDVSETGKVKGYLSDVWPEIRFVEEYLKGSTQTEQERLDFTYENQLKNNPFLCTNAIEFPFQNRPYSDLNTVPFIYEIFERVMLASYYTKLYKESGKRDEIYSVLGDFEYTNLKQSLLNSPELLKEFKNFSFSYENILRYMKSISNNGQGINWNLYIRGEYSTPYIKGLLEKDFGIYNISYLLGDTTTSNSSVSSTDKLKKYLSSNYSNDLTFSDGYPFNKLSWIKNNISEGFIINDVKNSNDTSKMFSFNETKKMVSSFSNDDDLYDKKMFTYFEWITNSATSPNEEVSNIESTIDSAGNTTYNTNLQVINYYNQRQQKDLYVTESFIDYGTKYDSTKNYVTNIQTTSLLNTPYFVNGILKGVENEKNNIENPYVGLGYLILNSLPLSTLREKYKSLNGTELNYIFATLNKVSAIHKIPYMWLLKYGSIWHRYKKHKLNGTDILDGIWEDFNYQNAYDPFNGDTSKSYTFNNYNGDSVTIKQYEQLNEQITINSTIEPFVIDRINNGFYPKVINDVYYYFTKVDLFTAYTSTEIVEVQQEKNLRIGNTNNGKINLQGGKYMMNSWSQFIETKENYDFKEYDSDKILIIPSFGDVKFNQTRFECFNNLGNNVQNVTTNPSIFNGSVRSLWSAPNYGYFSNEMIDKPTPSQYVKYINPQTKNNQAFNLSNNTSMIYSSIEDMFGVFTKDMLDVFETHFLNFCEVDDKFDPNLVNRGLTTFEEFLQSDEVKSQYGGSDVPEDEKIKWRAVFENENTTINGININQYYLNLTNFMKSLLMIDKPTLTNDINKDISEISKKQISQFKQSSIDLLKQKDVIFKIGNPNKYNNKVYGSITTLSTQTITDKYDFGNYILNTLPTSGGTITLGESISLNPNAWNALYQYVGEYSQEGFIYSDNGSYVTDFFVDMGYEFNEDNVKLLSPLIKIYATKKSENNEYNKNNFISELNDFITEQENFQRDILNHVFIKLNKDLPPVETTEDTFRISRVDGNLIKLELWKSFQALNDKWVAGQDFKNRTIFEDFLFMDRANRPVGDKILIDVSELEGYLTSRNDKMSVYSLMGIIYKTNNFIFMPVPAYTNFYGRNERVKTSEPIPQDIPNDLFGTFMEVDVRDSKPKMLGIYAGEPSTNLSMGQNDNSRRGDDSFDITIPSTCPLRENQQNKTDYSDSNLCVGFQVDFGKRNQGVFNSVSIDMNQHTNIGPTFEVLAGLGSQATGQQVAQQSQSLVNFYKTRSYKCQVQSMGNAMIQPTMYFNLTNVPMFYGPYMIMNVNHSITSRGFTTQFEGVRMPKYSLTQPDKLVASVNKEILKSYKKKLKNYQDNTSTGKTNNTITLSNLTDIKQGSVEKCQSLTKYPDKVFVDLVKTSINANTISQYLNNQNISSKIKLFIYGISTQNKSLRENVYNYNLLDLPTNKEIRPTERTKHFNAQACVENSNLILPIASFNSINDSLNFMVDTYKSLTTFADRMNEYVQLTSVNDSIPKTLTLLYMSQIYELNSVNGTPQQVNDIIMSKVNSDTEYKKIYDMWLGIFKSVVNRVSL